MQLISDDLLIAKRLLDGDEAAFREVFNAFFPRLYRYALAQLGGNGEEARDLVQQTFCKAFERLDCYRGEASLYGWMWRICRNAIIDRARGAHFRHVAVTSADDGLQAIVEAIRAPEAEQPEQQLVRLRLIQLIQATLDALPERYGDVLEWKYIEGLSVNEIAEQLAIAPKAAESLLTRARNAFKETIVSLGHSTDELPWSLSPAEKG